MKIRRWDQNDTVKGVRPRDDVSGHPLYNPGIKSYRLEQGSAPKEPLLKKRLGVTAYGFGT